MADQDDKDADKRRDDLALRVLNTPPKPKKGKSRKKQTGDK